MVLPKLEKLENDASLYDFIKTSNDYEEYINQILEVKMDLTNIQNKYKSCCNDKSKLRLFSLALKLSDDCINFINQKEIIEEVEKSLERYYNKGYLVYDIIFQRLPVFGYISKYFQVDGVFEENRELRERYLDNINNKLKELKSE